MEANGNKVLKAYRFSRVTLARLDALVEWQKEKDKDRPVFWPGGVSNATRVLENLVGAEFERQQKERIEAVGKKPAPRIARKKLKPSRTPSTR